MCGIAGIINFDKSPVELPYLEIMAETLASRGPDDTGVWARDWVGFAHKRLAILDLSYAGHQPMVDVESGSVIVFNGEIYNYRELRKELEGAGYSFVSNSDTEVLLKAYVCWKHGCLERINGMFAFAIWDGCTKELFAARDRLGVKPFYYLVDDKKFIFASRPKAIMSQPGCNCGIDQDALGLYLDVGFVPAPWSLSKGVKKLEPGCCLTVRSDGKVESRQYWSLIDKWREPIVKISSRDSSERLFELIKDSVRLRLVSDVPLGLFLSGGVDSAAVLAGMSENVGLSQIRTFCVNFCGDKCPDAVYARQLAKHLGSEHYEYDFRPQDLLDITELLPELYDEPIADVSLLPSVALCEFSRKYVTVCLSGDGGDELFGGYPNYRRLRWFNAVRQIPCLSLLLKSVLRVGSGHTGLLASEAMNRSSIIELAAFMRMSRKDVTRPVTDQFSGGKSFYHLAADMGEKLMGVECVRQASCLDALYFMADDNLQKMDVASMAFGLEVRVPLLDYRIVEFAAKLPLSHRIMFGKQKYVLRKAVESKMPEGFFNRPKTGFAPPVGQWLRNELRDWAFAELSKENISGLGILDYQQVRNILEQHVSGRRNYSSYVWLLINLIRWYKYYVAGCSLR